MIVVGRLLFLRVRGLFEPIWRQLTRVLDGLVHSQLSETISGGGSYLFFRNFFSIQTHKTHQEKKYELKKWICCFDFFLFILTNFKSTNPRVFIMLFTEWVVHFDLVERFQHKIVWKIRVQGSKIGCFICLDQIKTSTKALWNLIMWPR